MATPASATENAKVTVRLDGPTRARLERDAAQNRRPVSSMARLLIADALADRERQGERGSSGRLEDSA
jgi:hypothetical protein